MKYAGVSGGPKRASKPVDPKTIDFRSHYQQLDLYLVVRMPHIDSFYCLLYFLSNILSSPDSATGLQMAFFPWIDCRYI